MRLLNLERGVEMKNISVIIIIALFLGMLLSLNLYAANSNKPSEIKTAKVEKDKAQSQAEGKSMPIITESNENSRAAYYGETGDRVEDSYRFLDLHKDIWNLENPRQELRLQGIIGPDKIDTITTTVVFDQVVNGVKVRYGECCIHYKSDGLMYLADVRIDPEARTINTSPAISQEQAIDIARQDTLVKDPNPKVFEPKLLIGRFNGKMLLFWQFGFGYDWSYAVDAHTGKILGTESAWIR
jgi:Zn-dependent metalloprotease